MKRKLLFKRLVAGISAGLLTVPILLNDIILCNAPMKSNAYFIAGYEDYDEEANKMAIYSFLIKEMGYSKSVAIGIMSNIAYEGGYNPANNEDSYSSPTTSNNKDPLTMSGGLGILQWTNNGCVSYNAGGAGRRTNLINAANKDKDTYLSLEFQLEFLKSELEGAYSSINSYMLDLSEKPDSKEIAGEAASYWCINMEVPDNKYVQGSLRSSAAQTEWYDAWIDKTPDGSYTGKGKTATYLSNKIKSEEEEALVALSGPEDEVIQQLNSSQKDAYMIIANKYMTDVELSAMEWNLVISQFAVPYKENVQDVWQHSAFTDMREKGLVIDDNPYLTNIQDNLRALNAEALDKAIDLGIDITGETEPTVKTYMDAIADCMLETDGVVYSPLYKDGNLAYVSDLFDTDTYALTVKDKIAVTGSASAKTELWDALQEMQKEFLCTQNKKEELAAFVTIGSSIFDVELPVWLNTDSTMMYNAIYVANAIRIGGYGNFDNFLDAVGNSQLYIDRWGNICAYLKIKGEFKYTIVYPAYSNPIFTSTEVGDDDFAGFVYENFDIDIDHEDKQTIYQEVANPGTFWSEDIIAEGAENASAKGGVDTVVSILPTRVAKSYGQLKETYISESFDNLEENDYLGQDTSRTLRVIDAKTSDGAPIGGVYSRIRSKFSSKRDIIPIIEVDTTDNMLFNKAVLSAYTRDSYTKVTTTRASDGSASPTVDGTSTAYYSNDWYKCLNDSNTSYTSFALSSQYDSNRQDALFSNSLVFDKYYTRIFMGGGSDLDVDKGYKPLNYRVQEQCTAVGVQDWRFNGTNGVGYFEPIPDSYYIQADISSGPKIKDTTSTADNIITQYPFMQMHSYRKGIYADEPNLQGTKSKDFKDSALWNLVIEDRYISKSFNFENTITSDADSYAVGPLGGTDTQVPIEIYWDAMYTDSDKFKTYAVFNYTKEAVPSNSCIYGMGHRLTKDNQGSTYFVIGYMDNNMNDDVVMGRTYMSIPLFDATLDTGTSWSIWNNISVDSFVDSKQDGPRIRSMPNGSYISDMTVVNQSTFFEPVAITSNSGTKRASALRFMLNDQRVSDILENYPLEDITLLSFVWRNYYIPQTPFRTKLNLPEKQESNNDKDKEEETTEEETTEATTEEVTTTTAEPTTATDEDGSIVTEETIEEEETTEDSRKIDRNNDDDMDEGTKYKLAQDGVIFNIGEDNFLAENAILTPYNAICDDSTKVNNSLVWTQACSETKEHQMSLNDVNNRGMGNGEVDKLHIDAQKIYRASYNFGIVLLAVNKNTQGDNLINLVSNYDAQREFNTDDLLSNVAFFFEHPVIAISNIILGFIQFIHNNVAVGSIGNVFDLSWMMNFLIDKGYIKLYITISAGICCAVLVLRGFRFMTNKNQNFSAILREWGSAICLSTVPVILLYCLSNSLHMMSVAMTKDVAGQLASIEIEKEITASENLNINFETVYSAYKEQFNDIEDGYSKLSLQVPDRWDASRKKLLYKDITLKELYDTVEYSNMLADAKLEAQKLEAVADSDTTDIRGIYTNQNPGVSSLYYSYTEFVPVNYNHYDENIFYYFYDYIKYQYLAYWARQEDGNSAEYSAAAKKFSLPKTEEDSDEKWSSYINRMWDAEVYMLQKSYNGMYLMYHDDEYIYDKIYDDKGQPVYSGAFPSDILGLSYLFNMVDSRFEKKGYTASPATIYVDAVKKDLDVDVITTTSEGEEVIVSPEDSLLIWQEEARSTFDSTVRSYGNFYDYLRHSDLRDYETLIPPFYPVVYLMDNPIWGAMVNNSNVLTDDKLSNRLEDYKFTPSYLEEYFKNDDTYKDYIRIPSMNTSSEAMTYGTDYRQHESLKYENMKGKRIPWRLYASRSTLYRSTYDGENCSKKELPLETKLMDINEKAFKQIKDLTEYMPGSIRDSSLIFASAVIVTMEFNKAFSNVLQPNAQLQPQSYVEDSMDLDKFMRVTYARDMDEIVKNRNVIYMIYEQEGGLLTAFIVCLTEIAILLTMLARAGVLIMLLLGCAYVCFCFAFHSRQLVRQMVIGLAMQLLNICLSQFILILAITQSMKWVASSNTTITRLLLAIASLLICIALMLWSMNMFLAMLRDFNNFGGAIIQGRLNGLMQRVETAFTDIRHNRELRDINANVQNASINENEYGNDVEVVVTRRRSRNARNMDNQTTTTVANNQNNNGNVTVVTSTNNQVGRASTNNSTESNGTTVNVNIENQTGRRRTNARRADNTAGANVRVDIGTTENWDSNITISTESSDSTTNRRRNNTTDNRNTSRNNRSRRLNNTRHTNRNEENGSDTNVGTEERRRRRRRNGRKDD